MDPFTLAQWIVRGILAVLFVGMGILHFVPGPRRAMQAMIPPRMRGKGIASPASLVAISGIAEIIGGLGLLVPVWGVRFAAGMGLIALLVAVFPANAYAAKHPEKFGAAAVPVTRRLVAQIVLGALVLFAVV